MKTDVLIVGGGIAGLFCALTCVKAEPSVHVIVAAKGQLDDSNSSRAQGGVACVILKNDSFEGLQRAFTEHITCVAHIADTMRAGAGMCCEEVVRDVVSQAPARIAELIEYGVKFTKVSAVYFSLSLFV